MQTVDRLKFLAAGLDLTESIKVVDIGANPIEGDAPYKPLLHAGLCEVVGFEPQAEAYQKLLAMKGPNETYHNAAVGDGGKHTLYIYRASGFSSLFKLNADAVRTLGIGPRQTRLVGELEVQTRRLDDFDAIGEIDFLKIDIQGGELAVFQNARWKLSSTLAIQTEMRYLRLYDDEPSFGHVDLELLDQGFEMHSILTLKRFLFASENRAKFRRRIARQMVDGDTAYVRNIRNLEKYTAVQLKKLCLLADGVFGSFDLAVKCIEMLIEMKVAPLDLAEEYIEYIPENFRLT